MEITDGLIAFGSLATAVLAYFAYQNIKLTRISVERERNINAVRKIMDWVNSGYELFINMGTNIKIAQQRDSECDKLAIYGANGLEVCIEARKLGQKIEDTVFKAQEAIDDLHSIFKHDEEWFNNSGNLNTVLTQITDANIALVYVSVSMEGLKP